MNDMEYQADTRWDAPDLYGALSQAQADMPNATLNRENPYFKSKYADLSSIREATLPSLTKHGLGILQYTKVETDGLLFLYTRLVHKSGQWIEGRYPVLIDKPQAMGSALTYARRYCWAAMCGVASEDDDDANAAQGDKNPNKKTKAKARPDYDSLTKAMRECKTKAELEAWNQANADDIEALPDDWLRHLDNDYRRTMEGLPV